MVANVNGLALVEQKALLLRCGAVMPMMLRPLTDNTVLHDPHSLHLSWNS